MNKKTRSETKRVKKRRMKILKTRYVNLVSTSAFESCNSSISCTFS